MFLKKLNLTNFRNYSSLELSFDNRTTILVGNNAAGKSNLLESVYLLSTTKSLRVETEDELIKKGEEFCRVEGFGEDTELLVIINRQTSEVNFRKKTLVNGIPRRATDFIGNLPAVIFYPSDINMITGSPSLRRWHLDLALAQIDPNYEQSSNFASLSYKKALTLYEQFLTARNRVLKRIREGQGKKDELDYWTKGVVENGKIISEKRLTFFEYINNLEKPLGGFIFDYQPSEVTVEKLIETNGREVAAAATLIGPHRDDFEVLVYDNVIPVKAPPRSGKYPWGAGIHTNYLYRSQIKSGMTEGKGRNLARFGSRGEQRTGTLAFKLAQLEYMAKVLGKRPILLLDDVFSELDASHRAHVVEIVSKQQTVIATVELENIPQEFLESSRVIKVENGQLSEARI